MARFPSLDSFKEPNQYEQPGYFWDQYYVTNVAKGTNNNDNGGVHTNSSLLNVITGQKCRGGACAMQRLMTADGYMSWISSVRFRMTDKTGNNIDGA